MFILYPSLFTNLPDSYFHPLLLYKGPGTILTA